PPRSPTPRPATPSPQMRSSTPPATAATPPPRSAPATAPPEPTAPPGPHPPSTGLRLGAPLVSAWVVSAWARDPVGSGAHSGRGAGKCDAPPAPGDDGARVGGGSAVAERGLGLLGLGDRALRAADLLDLLDPDQREQDREQEVEAEDDQVGPVQVEAVTVPVDQ